MAENIIQMLAPSMMNDETITSLVDFYKLFADNSRLKILYAISMSEICVNDLAKLLNMNQSAISHQLRTLRDANLVKCRREGKMIYYSVDDEHIGQILLQGILHLSDRG
jgi:ArsR family transcriptional regulator